MLATPESLRRRSRPSGLADEVQSSDGKPGTPSLHCSSRMLHNQEDCALRRSRPSSTARWRAPLGSSIVKKSVAALGADISPAYSRASPPRAGTQLLHGALLERRARWLAAGKERGVFMSLGARTTRHSNTMSSTSRFTNSSYSIYGTLVGLEPWTASGLVLNMNKADEHDYRCYCSFIWNKLEGMPSHVPFMMLVIVYAVTL
ncbi:hypothetical protein PENSPDRAFT_645628 [Peniophora sp. CONT]|nr:hypothetical protein PENSPDRAFT_645628 [Peniophora sp. CONT]